MRTNIPFLRSDSDPRAQRISFALGASVEAPVTARRAVVVDAKARLGLRSGRGERRTTLFSLQKSKRQWSNSFRKKKERQNGEAYRVAAINPSSLSGHHSNENTASFPT